MNKVDKTKLSDHLQICVELSESKGKDEVAEVLRNLKQEVEEDQFAPDET